MTIFPLAATLGAVALFSASAPTTSEAHGKDRAAHTSVRADDSSEHTLQRHIKRLRKHLPVGHTESFYRDRLADRGWRITAVNQDEPLYIEYEIVRGDLTAEVQMKLDRETDQTIQVAVLENPILREATEIELARNQRMAQLAETESEGVETAPWWDTTEEHRPFAPSGYSETGRHEPKRGRVSGHAYHPFSDRDRVRIEHMAERKRAAMLGRTDQRVSLNDPNYVLVITPILIETGETRSGMEEMIRDLEALPVGKSRQFYRSTLQDRGYRIFDAASKGNRTQFGVEKDGQRALLSLWFDQDGSNSTQVTAFPLLLNIAPRPSSPTADIARRPDAAGHMVHELHSLPVGQDSRFYRQALHDHGYRVTKTRMEANHAYFEAEKNGQEVFLNVKLDEHTGKSTNVEALTKGEPSQFSSQMSHSQYGSDASQ